ncbi:MAG: Gfo/Idh/MocA family oxidoreductase [Cyclobacteriaceae bacterium]
MRKKIALVGCGIWGQKILRDLLNLQCIVDVFDMNEAACTDALSLGAQSFNSGLPSSASYDGIIVATPSITHRTILERISPLGLPIFVEKPLTTSLEDALHLREVLHERVYVMHIWLYHPGIRMLSEIAKSEELGKVLSLRSKRCNWTSPRKDIDSIWNLAPHDITICQSILGFLPDPVFSTVERYKNGIARGMVGVLGNNPSFIFEISNRYETKLRDVRLHCENGVAVLKDEKVDYLEIYHGDDESDLSKIEIEKRRFGTNSALIEELREFINYLEGGPSPRSNLEHGVQVVRVIDSLIKMDS